MEVSTAQLDVARRPLDAGGHVSHDAVGLTGVVERLPAVPPTLVVLEATGGLEVPGTGALAAAGRPGVGVNPGHARAFAQATGRLAQTETIEARWRSVGTALKVALTACRRQVLTILHAMLKHRTPWQENDAHHA